MRQHKTRYGFVITDRELVVLRRVDDDNGGTGHLELAAPLWLTTAGTAAQPQLTVPLALWYLGMLSSQYEGNDCWNLSMRSRPHLQPEPQDKCLNYGVADLDDVVPSEITFHKKLAASTFAYVFLVSIRGQACVMKVHHGVGPRKYYDTERELDIHVLEATAYRRLQDKGVCDRGIVPRFLGAMRKFDPSLCLPQLRKFVRDEHLPSALFLEYIPNMEPLQLHNFTTERADNLMEGIRQIHNALVLHNDPKPRNKMLAMQPNGKERVSGSILTAQKPTMKNRSLLNSTVTMSLRISLCSSTKGQWKRTLSRGSLRRRFSSTALEIWFILIVIYCSGWMTRG
ncbi:uncharacterized protein BDV14DRAFT_84402 [Aspergillus stella-maris]|uniref:uncharacterized protein n=1 Tax=Aspergillus stella-maris TaxID=1810926 RepID=UPI003CCD6E28